MRRGGGALGSLKHGKVLCGDVIVSAGNKLSAVTAVPALGGAASSDAKLFIPRPQSSPLGDGHQNALSSEGRCTFYSDAEWFRGSRRLA